MTEQLSTVHNTNQSLGKGKVIRTHLESWDLSFSWLVSFFLPDKCKAAFPRSCYCTIFSVHTPCPRAHSSLPSILPSFLPSRKWEEKEKTGRKRSCTHTVQRVLCPVLCQCSTIQCVLRPLEFILIDLGESLIQFEHPLFQSFLFLEDECKIYCS